MSKMSALEAYKIKIVLEDVSKRMIHPVSRVINHRDAGPRWFESKCYAHKDYGHCSHLAIYLTMN